MRGRRQERIEALVDRVAAAVLAAAVGFSLFEIQGGMVRSPRAVAVCLAATAACYVVASRLLRKLKPARPRFAVADFALRPLELDQQEELLLTEQVELLLTEADRVAPTPDELVLDDILASLGPQSRVVRLFDPAAMPTPGQLNARIEWHLQGSRAPTPTPAPPDASDALFQALSELRRSLR